MIKYIYILLFLNLPVYAEFVEESRWERFIHNFYSKPGHVVNQVYLKFDGGISNLTSYSLTSETNLAQTQNLEGYYGFVRIDKETGNSDLFKHQSEFAFLGNVSTDFKTLDFNFDGIKSDAWRFGFGLNDGFGFLSDGKPLLHLTHSTAISFLRVDFDGVPQNTKDADFIKTFDRKFKFGQIYSGGLRFKIYEFVHLNANYEMSQYYRDFQFMNWFGMWMTDNLLQRWIDYFEPDLIKVLGNNYPWVKFAYKNFVSLISYNLRKHEMYFPFKSEPPLYYDAFKIGLTLII